MLHRGKSSRKMDFFEGEEIKIAPTELSLKLDKVIHYVNT